MVLCLLGILWGLINTRRIIEPPFLYSSGLAILILPQLYFVLLNPNRVPQSGFYLFCAMVILCTIGLFLGYQKQRRPRTRYEWRLRDSRLIYFGFVVAFVGTVGYLQVYRMDEVSEWRGWPVYWITLAKLTLPGLTLLALAYFRRSSGLKLIWLIVFAFFPVLAVILYGRRSLTLLLPFVFLLPYMIQTPKFQPARTVVLAGLVGALIVVYAFPYWRGEFVDYSHAEALERMPVSEVIEEVFRRNSDKVMEIVDGIVVVSTVSELGIYDWRLKSVYNDFIKLYVPGGLIGYELKRSLLVEMPDLAQLARRTFGFDVAFYTAKTGFSDLFYKFWLFGCLFVFLVARLYRHMFDLIRYEKDGRAVLFIVFFFSFPASLTYDAPFYYLATQLPVIVVFVVALFFCVKRIPKKQ